MADSALPVVRVMGEDLVASHRKPASSPLDVEDPGALEGCPRGVGDHGDAARERHNVLYAFHRLGARGVE
jgi:hypothetical protein